MAARRLAGPPRGGAVRVALLHPELGLGGAERVMLDAATCLRRAGVDVVVFTTGRDAASFPEAADGSLEVRVTGRPLPRTVLQRLRAACTVARMAWLSWSAARARPRFDLYLCDTAAHAIPLLKRLGDAPVVYYGHYPDRLLAPPDGFAPYRRALDRLEARGLAAADRVLVNSRHTAAAFGRAFPALRLEPVVVAPGVDVDRYAPVPPVDDGGEIVLLTLSRLAPEKRLDLPVRALALLVARLDPSIASRLRLVIAGGYDARLVECVRLADELEALAGRLGVAGRVEVVRSPSEAERLALLIRARCLLHAHEAEPFGLAPLEAMAAARPVVAVSAGGPLETVLDGVTGRLVPATPEAFAEALLPLVTDPERARRIGEAGRAHVAAEHSLERFGARLVSALQGLPGARM